MREVSIEERFHGTCVLVILQLRRAAKSNDLEEGFAAARELKMIGDDHERFLRSCLAADEALQAGERPELEVTPELMTELRACVMRLNSADPA